jgi:ankyrin repeat protein
MFKASDRQGICPLHVACREGYLSIAEYLIDHGAKLDSIDTDNWTAIHHACAKGHLHIVQFIYARDKDNLLEYLDMRTSTNVTCLHLAVQSGHFNLVAFILDCFTDDMLTNRINECVELCGTPLHIAGRFIFFIGDIPNINE